MGVYKAVDVLANPFRNGGGVSVAMAMSAGIAVCSARSCIDARSWLGDELVVADEEYEASLLRMVSDAAWRLQLGQQAQQRLSTLGRDQFRQQLEEVLSQAQALFAARLAGRGPTGS